MRLDNWPILLDQHIQAAGRRPFAWGRHDCCTFACDGALAITGADPMGSLRGAYRDAASASRALIRFAGGGLDEAAIRLGQVAGYQAVFPLNAQRGDIVLAEVMTDRGAAPALGLIGLDGQSALFAAANGLARLPINACRLAWRVE